MSMRVMILAGWLTASLAAIAGPASAQGIPRNLPRKWLAMVRQAMLTITPRFSARRMLKDYVRTAYAPAMSKRR